MRGRIRAATAFTASLLLVPADAAYSYSAGAEQSGGGQYPASDQIETRRRINRTCNTVGVVVGTALGLIFGGGRRNDGSRRDGFNEGAAIGGGLAAGLICRAATWRSVHRRDQEEVNRRVAAMALDPSLNNQTYTSTETRRTYQLSASAVTYQPVQAEFTTLAEVDAPPEGSKVVTVPYRVVASSLNIRASLRGDVITGTFNSGDVVQVISESADGQWVLVGYDHIGYGWVARRFLEPVFGIAQGNIVYAQPRPPPAPRATPSRRQAQAGRGRGGRGARVQTQVASAPVPAGPRVTRVSQVNAQMPCRNATVQGRGSDSNRVCTSTRGAVVIGA